MVTYPPPLFTPLEDHFEITLAFSLRTTISNLKIYLGFLSSLFPFISRIPVYQVYIIHDTQRRRQGGVWRRGFQPPTGSVPPPGNQKKPPSPTSVLVNSCVRPRPYKTLIYSGILELWNKNTFVFKIFYYYLNLKHSNRAVYTGPFHSIS